MRDTRSSITPIQKAEITSSWSDSVGLTLDQPPANFPARVMIGGLAFLSLFLAWAWFGHIEEVSHAQGQLVPEGEVYNVQPIMQGEITHILVEEGEYVKAGEALVECDRQLVEKDVERLKENLLAYQLQHSQITGLIAQTGAELQTIQAITQSDIQAQQAAIAQSHAGAATNQQIIQQLEADIQAHESRIERLRPLVEAGALTKEYLFNAEQELSNSQQAITQNQGEVNQLLAENRQLQAGLSQKRSEGQRREYEIQQKLQELQIEADQLQAQIIETQTVLGKAETEMKQLVLYAPVDGIISALNIHNIGEVVKPGQTVIEISPSDAPLVLSAKLPSQEAGLVQKGMLVQMKFDAFPYQDYGVFLGKVISISPDAIEDERLGTVYQLEIALEQDYVKHEDQMISLNAGQTATAEIIIRKRRIMNIIFDPIRQLNHGGINF